MLKVTALIAAKPGLSREAFIDYYENSHAPLILRLTRIAEDYRRNYLSEDLFGRRDVVPFDCITELRFGSRTDFDTFLSRLAAPDVQPLVEADEERFMDRKFTRFFVVEEFISRNVES